MKIHISYSATSEYYKIRPIVDILSRDRDLKMKEKYDNEGRKHIYFVSMK